MARVVLKFAPRKSLPSFFARHLRVAVPHVDEAVDGRGWNGSMTRRLQRQSNAVVKAEPSAVGTNNPPAPQQPNLFTFDISPSWPMSIAWHAPFMVLKTLEVPSALAVTSREPVALKLTSKISSLCPRSVWTHCPEATSHTFFFIIVGGFCNARGTCFIMRRIIVT